MPPIELTSRAQAFPPRVRAVRLFPHALVMVLFAWHAAAATAQEPAGRRGDSLGDSLPPRAVQRLGSRRPAAELPEGFATLDSLREVRFSPDGRLLATRGESGVPADRRRADVWEVATGRRLHSFSTQDLPLAGLGFSPDGRMLVTETPLHIQGLQVWSLAQNQALFTTSAGRGGLYLSRRENTVSVITPFGRNDVVRTLRLETGEEVRRFVIENLHRFEFSPDGESLAAVKSAGDTTVRLVHIAADRVLQKFEGCPAEPGVLAFSPDGRTLAAACSRRAGIDQSEHHLFLWEVATGGMVHALSPPARVLALAVSPDNRWLAAGCADRQIHIFEIATGETAGRLEGHSGPVSALDFSPEGDRLASGSLDRTVLLWDASGGFQSQLAPGPLTETDLEDLWTQLASASPTPAYRARGQILHTPEQTATFLHTRVRELLVPVESLRIQQFIAHLRDADYRIRNRATEELTKIREIARPLLLKEFRQTGSEEVRHRIRRILGGAEPQERFNAADHRRMARIIHALQAIDLPDAVAALELIAAEFPDETIARAARQALQRGAPR